VRSTDWDHNGRYHRLLLAAVALPRVDLPRELGVELAAAMAHAPLGVAVAALRPITGADLFRPEATRAAMPVAEPDLTVREVRADPARLLPGAGCSGCCSGGTCCSGAGRPPGVRLGPGPGVCADAQRRRRNGAPAPTVGVTRSSS
jgi:hypothetical protein